MKLAIFDIDGTLTNTNGVDGECFVQAFAETHGITNINTDWSDYTHTTDSGITLQIFRDRFKRAPTESELNDLKQCFVRLLAKRLRNDSASFMEIDGAAAAFNRLRQNSEWTVAIATGCWRESALLKLKAVGINIDKTPAAFAEDAFSRERILHMAIANVQQKNDWCKLERIVSIGDGVWDVRAARNCNLAFLGVSSGETEVALRDAGAETIIEDFTEYNEFVCCLNVAEKPAPS